MKDPFVDQAANAPLVLGGVCAACDKIVCVSPSCSLFYARRICATCCARLKDALPVELKMELSRLEPRTPAEGEEDEGRSVHENQAGSAEKEGGDDRGEATDRHDQEQRHQQQTRTPPEKQRGVDAIDRYREAMESARPPR